MKEISVFFIIYLLPFVTFSQSINQNDYFRMPAVAPSSPNVASMEKFGNIPVDYSTGATSITVPIWNIKCGNISWPLSLSYHTAGIKVDEVASNVGIGWALLGEGAISRSVVGRPDEETTVEPNFSTVSNNDWYYLYNVRDGIADSELDIYSYNFNGRSGKFLINQDGSIFHVPYTNMKITITATGFVIIDEEGVKYTFDKKETITSLNASGYTVYTSSWHLTKIETADRKQGIEFTYADAGTFAQTFINFTQSMGKNLYCRVNAIQYYKIHMLRLSTVQ